MSSNIRDIQLIVATTLYNQNPNISSRDLARQLPNSSGGNGVRLQSAQQILREIKNVPVNQEMVINPYGQKGKPPEIPIVDKTKEKEKHRFIDGWFSNGAKRPNMKPNGKRRYKYYLAVQSTREFYPYNEPNTDFITYGFNNSNEMQHLIDTVTAVHWLGLKTGNTQYYITDGENEINEYEVV